MQVGTKSDEFEVHVTIWRKLALPFVFTPLLALLAFWAARERGAIVGMPLGALLRIALLSVEFSAFGFAQVVGSSRLRRSLLGGPDNASILRSGQWVASAVLLLVGLVGTIPGLVDQYTGDSGLLLPYQIVPGVVMIGLIARWIWKKERVEDATPSVGP
jgi:fucose 4-O-acetylase-like acetyltransferase